MEALTCSEGGREPGEILVVDVFDGAALATDQVVMGDLFLHLERAVPGAEECLLHQVELHQEIQCAVDGGDVHVGEAGLHVLADFLGAHVRPVSAQYIPHQRALRCEAVPELSERACRVMSHVQVQIYCS